MFEVCIETMREITQLEKALEEAKKAMDKTYSIYDCDEVLYDECFKVAIASSPPLEKPDTAQEFD